MPQDCTRARIWGVALDEARGRLALILRDGREGKKHLQWPSPTIFGLSAPVRLFYARRACDLFAVEQKLKINGNSLGTAFLCLFILVAAEIERVKGAEARETPRKQAEQICR